MKSLILTSSFGVLLSSLFFLGLNSESVNAQTPNNPDQQQMSCPCCKDMMDHFQHQTTPKQ